MLPYAPFVCTTFALLAFMNISDDSLKVFKYFVNLTTTFGILTLNSILVTHIYFTKARRVQDIPDSALSYRAPLGIWGSYFALSCCVIIALTRNYGAFLSSKKPFDFATFITAYLGIPLYLALIAGHMLVTKSRAEGLGGADSYSGKDIIEVEETEFLERQRERAATATGSQKFYNCYVSWLF